MTEAEARDLKRQYSRRLMALDAVSAVGITRTGGGRTSGPENDFVLAVFLTTEETPTLRSELSRLLEGNDFITVFSGKFRPHMAAHTGT
jgi:hypothetical protein